MPVQDSVTRQTVNNLIKGLVTETSDLAFPEGATLDESNCDLDLSGIRRRRKAVAEEVDSTVFSEGSDFTPTTLYRTYLWEKVENLSKVSFVVQQVGKTIYFYEKSGQTISFQKKDFSIDLDTYSANTLTPSDHPISVANIRGWLVIVSPAINSILVRLNSDRISISIEEIDFKVRDFEILDRDSRYDLAPPSPTEPYRYDLRNMGWTPAAIEKYFTETGLGPPRNSFWWAGKDNNGDFEPDNYGKIFAGNTFAGNGHFILDLFDKDRSAVALEEGHVVTLPKDTDTSRFSTCVVFAGRVFYAGLTSNSKSSHIYFTKTVEETEDLGVFHQVADPTAETIPDLVDSDGGVVNILEADCILHMAVYGNSLLIFANNGLWQLTGTDTFFKATGYGVDTISSVDLISKDGIVNVEGVPIWWGSSGIYTVDRNEISDRPIVKNLSIASIQSFYEDISFSAKKSAITVYDKTNRKVSWFYPQNGESLGSSKLTEVLVFDVTLGAFYPWSISTPETEDHYVVGAFFDIPTNTSGFTNIVTSGGDEVTDSSDNNIIANAQETTFSNTNSQLKLTLLTDTGLTFGGFESDSFLDWGTEDYSSYFETGYNFIGDLWQYKYCDGLVSYFSRTETGFELNEDGLSMNLVKPSSCFMQVKWGGVSSTQSMKFTSPQQVYRLPRLVVAPTDEGDFEFEFDRVKTLTRVRGQGDSIRIKYFSEEGKDFVFHGYETVMASPRTYV